MYSKLSGKSHMFSHQTPHKYVKTLVAVEIKILSKWWVLLVGQR